MARARNIKPGFFQNEELGELPPIARLAFIGMWTVADFKGCIEYRSKRLKIQLIPYDDTGIDEIVTALDKSGFIRIYAVAGQRYIKIINFDRHQNPHKNERESGSDIPDMDENYIQINELKDDGTKPDKFGTAPADSLIPHPSSLIPQTEASKAAPRKRSDPTDVIARPDDVTEQTWGDWVKLRKSKKATVTTTVLNEAISEAGKAGLPLERFFQIWCSRGSQGLQADWLKPNERQSPARPAGRHTGFENIDYSKGFE